MTLEQFDLVGMRAANDMAHVHAAFSHLTYVFIHDLLLEAGIVVFVINDFFQTISRPSSRARAYKIWLDVFTLAREPLMALMSLRDGLARDLSLLFRSVS